MAVVVAMAASPTIADEWASYGRDPGGSRFSPLTQITTENVAGLRPVWTYHTGDVSDGAHGSERSGFETTPLEIDGRLYLTTPFNRIVALDPATGRELWSFDPGIDKHPSYGDGLINRGVAAWRDNKRQGRDCGLSLFEATLDARLLAVDARTGRPCKAFGRDGQVSLADVPNFHVGWYHMTSPPVVLDGVVIVGSAIDDNRRVDMPSGVVRGFDARNGKLLWKWTPLEKPANVPAEAWRTGAANAWSILSADPKRHLVYVPTGSASPDYYGGLRPGDNRWADSVVALHPRTGKMAWGFQLVHHDLWDYDTAAAPLLTELKVHGRRTPALVAGNKSGMLYVLDPATGRPALPIEERPVPQSNVPGEATAPTQPFPITLPSLAPQVLDAAAVWGRSEADRRSCREQLEKMSGRSVFSPPSLDGALAIPGAFGGVNWSGFAWDSRRGQLVVAVSNLPFKVRLIPAERFKAGERGDLRSDPSPQAGAPFAMSRGPLESESGLPCSPPPWGELVAVDLSHGRIAWRRPLGTMAEAFAGDSNLPTGSVILGGPIVTAGGLVFIGGTMDRRFRAVSAETGEVLWTAELPASAHATPITYSVGGRQFVVIAAGGSAKVNGEAQSDAIIAYALP